MARPKKKNVDWKSIEADWLLGETPIRELAQWYCISEGAIRLHAKTHGWPARKRVDTRPTQAKEKTEDPPAPAFPVCLPPALAEAAADTRMIVGRGKDLVLRLLDELDAVTTHRGDLEAMIKADTRGDDMRKRAAMMGAVSLPARAQIIKALATAAKTLADAIPAKGAGGGATIEGEALPPKPDPDSWDGLLN
jgi:hypothetical protein